MEKSVCDKFETYPNLAKQRLLEILDLIFIVAQEDELGEVQQSLKWGQASFTTVSGSPLRLAYDEKQPQSVSVYFNCNSKLIETFRQLYRESFEYVGNRELRLPISKNYDRVALKHCLSLALNYHRLKHLPLLGA